LSYRVLLQARWSCQFPDPENSPSLRYALVAPATGRAGGIFLAAGGRKQGLQVRTGGRPERVAGKTKTPRSIILGSRAKPCTGDANQTIIGRNARAFRRCRPPNPPSEGHLAGLQRQTTSAHRHQSPVRPRHRLRVSVPRAAPFQFCFRFINPGVISQPRPDPGLFLAPAPTGCASSAHALGERAGSTARRRKETPGSEGLSRGAPSRQLFQTTSWLSIYRPVELSPMQRLQVARRSGPTPRTTKYEIRGARPDQARCA